MIRNLLVAGAAALLVSSSAFAQDYGMEGDADASADVTAEVEAPEPVATVDTSSNMDSTSSSTFETSTGNGSGAASDSNGRLGIGYFTGAAPVGIRMWSDDSSGFDLGIGLGFGTEPATSWAFALEGGYLIGLHTWENVRLFGRVGVGLGLNDPGAGGVNFNGNVNGLLGAEFFMAALGFPMLSFSGGIGAQIGFAKPDGGDFGLTFGTAAADPNIMTSVGAQLGFHIYMP